MKKSPWRRRLWTVGVLAVFTWLLADPSQAATTKPHSTITKCHGVGHCSTTKLAPGKPKQGSLQHDYSGVAGQFRNGR